MWYRIDLMLSRRITNRAKKADQNIENMKFEHWWSEKQNSQQLVQENKGEKKTDDKKEMINIEKDEQLVLQDKTSQNATVMQVIS